MEYSPAKNWGISEIWVYTKQWIALKARSDWLLKFRISFAIYLQATWEKMASRFASVRSEEIAQINFYGVNNCLAKWRFWVPETSRSFHYWHPAPRWRLPPWLANPGNPAMSPHAEGKKTGTCHIDETVERKGRTGEGRQPPRSLHPQKNAD